MAPKSAPDATRRRFAVWAVVPWIVLLLSALACAQYLQHGDYPYLAASLLVFAVCTCCILRLAWARQAMRAVAIVLALWSLVTGVLMLHHWGEFALARQQAMAQPQLGEMAVWLINRAQRTWEVGLVLKALAIPLLLWLTWRLGKPDVRAQFRPGR